jgi:diacylglycerol kinase (ATP)
VVVNPTKVDDSETLRHAIDEAMQSAGWEPPMWLATTAEDPGYGIAEQALVVLR